MPIFAGKKQDMERKVTQQLLQWKNSSNRKPLILLGARQVGKTYILKHFGREMYDTVAYLNFDEDVRLKSLFAQDYDTRRVLAAIESLTSTRVLPGKTLIILDEIQEAPRGLGMLKYFCENAPEYHVAVAGSLLGIAMHQGESFPVGKVDFIQMCPMDFGEFLRAMGRESMAGLLERGEWDTVRLLRDEYVQLLREYYFVGGMPEAVDVYVKSNSPMDVRQVQDNILNAYQRDFSKHTSAAEAVRISQAWQSVPSQLAKENKKFVYGVIRKGARAKDFELAIQWLVDAGLVYKVSRATKSVLPLKMYEDLSAFKLFLLDTGLLGALSHTPPSLMLLGNHVMEEAKGSFTENFVATQLFAAGRSMVYYYSKDDSTLEIDFLVQHETSIIPVEVKAEENLRSKSLHHFVSAHPDQRGLRFSMSDYREQDWMVNVPLYAAYCFL